MIEAMNADAGARAPFEYARDVRSVYAVVTGCSCEGGAERQGELRARAEARMRARCFVYVYIDGTRFIERRLQLLKVMSDTLFLRFRDMAFYLRRLLPRAMSDARGETRAVSFYREPEAAEGAA
ncbi:hypothetical protein YK56LOC_01560 [Caballeronia sp. HLA56]